MSATETAYAAYRVQKVAAYGRPFTLRLQRQTLEGMIKEIGAGLPTEGNIVTVFGVPVEVVDG